MRKLGDGPLACALSVICIVNFERLSIKAQAKGPSPNLRGFANTFCLGKDLGWPLLGKSDILIFL